MLPTSCHVLLESPGSIALAGDNAHDIRLFSKCRNEMLRLPAFLRHYRSLGVKRFFIVDNASTDGSLEYLTQQSDVHVFSTNASFRAARGGTDWLNALLARFGVGHWCVTVDVDELLFYAGSEGSDLAKLTAYLDERGDEALSCLLLDLYPEGPIRDCAYAAGDDLLAAAPFFDRDPYVRIPYHQCPGFLIYGGVRERVFYPEARADDLRRRLHVKLYHRVILSLPVLRGSIPILSRRPLFPPCLTKVPLVRWDASSQYLNVNHFVSQKVVAPESGVLLHFKLLQDFHLRASEEVSRGEYYDGAVEFRRYSEKLRADPRMTFRYGNSVRFESSTQLVELGLIQDTESWSRVRATN